MGGEATVSRSQGNRQRHRIWMTERHVDRKEMNPKATQDRWPSREPGTLRTGPSWGAHRTAGGTGAEPRWWGRSLGDSEGYHGDGGGDKIKTSKLRPGKPPVQTEPTEDGRCTRVPGQSSQRMTPASSHHPGQPGLCSETRGRLHQHSWARPPTHAPHTRSVVSYLPWEESHVNAPPQGPIPEN